MNLWVVLDCSDERLWSQITPQKQIERLFNNLFRQKRKTQKLTI